MVSNINYYSAIKNIEIEQMPQISNPVLNVFAKHVNCAFIPKNMDLNLKSRLSELNKIDQVLQKVKNSSTFHKIMSICLLTVTVSILAAATILTFVVNPFSYFLAFSAFFSTMAAQYLDEAFRPNVSMQGLTIPVYIESTYLVNAFNKTTQLEKQMDEQLEPFNKRLKVLKKLFENHPVIRHGIQSELQQIDLTKANVDMKRVDLLRTALDQLEKSAALIQKL